VDGLIATAIYSPHATAAAAASYAVNTYAVNAYADNLCC